MRNGMTESRLLDALSTGNNRNVYACWTQCFVRAWTMRWTLKSERPQPNNPQATWSHSGVSNRCVHSFICLSSTDRNGGKTIVDVNLYQTTQPAQAAIHSKSSFFERISVNYSFSTAFKSHRTICISSLTYVFFSLIPNRDCCVEIVYGFVVCVCVSTFSPRNGAINSLLVSFWRELLATQHNNVMLFVRLYSIEYRSGMKTSNNVVNHPFFLCLNDSICMCICENRFG